MHFTPSSTLAEYNRLARETDMLYHTIALNAGLSDSAFLIFYTILELGEGCLQKDICDMHSVSKQTVHSSIRKLEQDGYLTLSQDTRREKKIFLTPEGRRLVNEKIVPVMEMENEILNEMSKEDCQELLRLSQEYMERLRDKIAKL
ncbi:MAG: MarR family transcriptional regulator [Eubacteriales bacterium]|nr:MarR family transcriptional regulator [Eubacteriales bacterium]